MTARFIAGGPGGLRCPRCRDLGFGTLGRRSKPLGGRPKAKAARFTVGNAEGLLHRPNAQTRRMPGRPGSGVANGSMVASKGAAPSLASTLAFSIWTSKRARLPRASNRRDGVERLSKIKRSAPSRWLKGLLPFNAAEIDSNFVIVGGKDTQPLIRHIGTKPRQYRIQSRLKVYQRHLAIGDQHATRSGRLPLQKRATAGDSNANREAEPGFSNPSRRIEHGQTFFCRGDKTNSREHPTLSPACASRPRRNPERIRIHPSSADQATQNFLAINKAAALGGLIIQECLWQLFPSQSNARSIDTCAVAPRRELP
jgi:hypothetical protein